MSCHTAGDIVKLNSSNKHHSQNSEAAFTLHIPSATVKHLQDFPWLTHPYFLELCDKSSHVTQLTILHSAAHPVCTLQANKLLVTFTDTLIEEVCTSSLHILTAARLHKSPERSASPSP